jgi:hypothetical protein
MDNPMLLWGEIQLYICAFAEPGPVNLATRRNGRVRLPM